MSYVNLSKQGELLYEITSALAQVKALRKRKSYYRANYWAGGLEVMIHVYHDYHGESATVDKVEAELTAMGY